ncbi:PREDICTED: nucleolar protein 6 [Drosophila arizonae]|uniref:Nucleolar protein 6 n=1 Tax=Drosophila arizonae TaxID=7263 RepID=A0ABM1NTZ4_DROAR|nr:PREDICTED: nucleolar protein 6 [Drosophila arizonae]
MGRIKGNQSKKKTLLTNSKTYCDQAATAVTSSDDGFDEPKEITAPKRKLPSGNSEAKKKKFKHTEANVKPPTLEEIKEIRDTRNLFHSNLFKLQVKEMLEELQLKPKYSTYIENWLETFTTAVHEFQDGLLDNCQLEVPLHLHKKLFNFQFLTPTAEPKLIGAAAIGTLLGPKLVVDVALEMPEKCFQKEDYRNLIYDQKRALYLATVASKLKELPAFAADHFAYNYHANNPLKPVLELTPTGKIGKHLSLRLYITAPKAIFKLSRFVPWNNNVRPSFFGDKWDESETLPSTQHYNANVLFDLTLAENQKLMLSTFSGHRNFQEGLLLLKVWLRQRQLDVGFSGFSAHILAAYIVYLKQNRLLHQSSSSYQVARTVWNQLANSDWTQGITLCPQQPHQLSTLAGYYDVCFMDVTGYYNMCANLPLSVYKAVCAEAKLAVELLNDVRVNSFSQIFMQAYPLYTRMDNILKITNPATVDQLLELHVQPQVKYDYADYAHPQLLKLLTELLQKGLGKRVHAILPLETASKSWTVDTKAPIIGRSLTLGLILDPEHAFEVLDKGPATNEDAEGAAEFRKFWGEKSNLRRFQDGSITEAVVWAAVTDAPSKKRLIVRQIVLHLLEQHLQLEQSDVHYIAGELDIVYSLTSSFKVAKLQTKLKLEQETDAEAVTPLVIHCYDALARQLHTLGDLPLDIVSISGISPVFRYCEPQPLLPQARLVADRMHAGHVLRVIIQLGPSGKWPNELGALRSLKTAFLIQIGKQLKEQQHLHTQLCKEGLLVLKQGYCFLLELAHTKEVALLKQQQTERGVTAYVDNAASREIERRHYILPRVSGALHALHQSHSTFGPTVLIAKRWLATQMIDDGLWPSIATELLVAHLFQQRQTPHTTVAPQTGFIRFLQLLAHSDWASELFLLNFNNSWTEQQITDLEHSYRSERDSYPALCLATAYDQQHAGRLWTTDDCPSKPVLGRVTLLARHALQLIESSLLSPSLGFVRPAQLFIASGEGYDLVVELKPDLLPNTLCYDLGSPFLPFSQRNFRLPLAGIDQLAKIVQQLRSAYSEYAAFFYNPHGGKELAIVWRPASEFAPKPFKVNELQACTPCSAGKVQVVRDTLVEDFKLLLKDFYLRICTPEQLKREQRSHNKPKRYFDDQGEPDVDKPQKKKKKKGPVIKPTDLKKRLKKSKSLSALC